MGAKYIQFNMMLNFFVLTIIPKTFFSDSKFMALNTKNDIFFSYIEVISMESDDWIQDARNVCKHAS